MDSEEFMQVLSQFSNCCHHLKCPRTKKSAEHHFFPTVLDCTTHTVAMFLLSAVCTLIFFLSLWAQPYNFNLAIKSDRDKTVFGLNVHQRISTTARCQGFELSSPTMCTTTFFLTHKTDGSASFPVNCTTHILELWFLFPTQHTFTVFHFCRVQLQNQNVWQKSWSQKETRKIFLAPLLTCILWILSHTMELCSFLLDCMYCCGAQLQNLTGLVNCYHTKCPRTKSQSFSLSS